MKDSSVMESYSILMAAITCMPLYLKMCKSTIYFSPPICWANPRYDEWRIAYLQWRHGITDPHYDIPANSRENNSDRRFRYAKKTVLNCITHTRHGANYDSVENET